MGRFTDLRGRSEPPLPAWGAPYLGEPAHGYLLRIGSMNGVGSVSVLLNSYGLNGRALQMAECLDFALSFPIEGKEQLILATPIVSQTSVSLMGQHLRRRDWQISLRRFCPRLSCREPIPPRLWILIAFTRSALPSMTSTSSPRRFRSPDSLVVAFATHSPWGGELMRYDVSRLASPRISIESYILGRLGGLPPNSVPILDCFQNLGQSLSGRGIVRPHIFGWALRVRPIVDATPGLNCQM